VSNPCCQLKTLAPDRPKDQENKRSNYTMGTIRARIEQVHYKTVQPDEELYQNPLEKPTPYLKINSNQALIATR
jgi:hypothetical protein